MNITAPTQGVQKSESSSGGGSWAKLQYRSEPLYSPPSVVVAKRFLKTVSGKYYRFQKYLSPSEFDTPVTSRVAMCRTTQCHGCHGVIGGGLHNGSAPGKDRCTLLHSVSCQGNIPESDAWRACPNMRHPSFLSGAGFSRTLDPNDFQTAHSSTPQAANLFVQANIKGLLKNSLCKILTFHIQKKLMEI